MAQYKRILLKLSGESLMGGKQYGIDEVRLNEYAAQIKEIADQLNFPTQSFFGKYFKQYVGISPKEYRKGRLRIKDGI